MDTGALGPYLGRNPDWDLYRPHSDTRPINLPLGDMYRYAAGFKYRSSDDLTLGGGLSFLWMGDMEVKQAGNDKEDFVSGQYDDAFLTFLSFYVQWN